MMQNALTVDVEDWYQTNDFNFPVSDWQQYEDRVVANTLRIVELLSRFQVRGTFFILGSIAEKHPDLVEEIARNNHEIGSHGGWHRLLHELSEEQFREDLRYSKRVLEEITGRKVVWFRAPSWSIAKGRFEVLRILREEGFTGDSSVQPFRTPLSGISGAPEYPFAPVLDGKSLDLLEFPSTVLKMSCLTIPFSGGFYLRAMPYWFIAWALRRVNRRQPGMIYVHPWEIDTEQPRLMTSPLIQLAHYYNLHTTWGKLERLLRDFTFLPLSEIMEKGKYPEVHLSSDQ